MKDSRVIVGAFFGVAMTSAFLGAGSSPTDERAARAAAPVAVQRVAVPQAEFREETAMVVAGAVLIGVAAAVRRAA